MPANFPLGYARELASAEDSTSARPTDFSGRSARRRPRRNCGMMRRALAITEAGMARAMEVLTASKPGQRKEAALVGQDPDVGNSARRNRFRDFARRRIAREHNCRRRRSGVRSARARFRPAHREFAHHPRHFSARCDDRILRRPDANGRARTRQRSAAQALGHGQGGAGAGAEKDKAGRRWDDDSHAQFKDFSPTAVIQRKCAKGRQRRIFPRHRSRSRSRNS